MRFSLNKVLVGLIFVCVSNTAYGQCGCKFIINGDFSFDGTAKGVQPGDKICIANGTRSGILLKNINGTAANPVIITNMCDGEVFLNAPSNWGNCFTIEKSKNYRLTGSANPNVFYGIKVSGAVMGIQNNNFSTDFEIDHVYVTNVGCQGIAAKTDPKCGDTNLEALPFVLRNISFHDIKIENTGCEAFYIGNSHFDHGTDLVCSGVTQIVYEHKVDNVKVYNCKLSNIGNDGIQVGSATNVVVYDNNVIGVGVSNNPAHQNGIQMGDGTTQALVYNNYIDQARGYGIFDSGGGGTYYNNIILNSLSDGFFLRDDAPHQAPTGYTIVNNTIINSFNYAVYNLSENPNMSYFHNNIVVNQKPVYIYLNNANVKWTDTNNLKTLDINTVKFVNPTAKDYHLLSTSPALNTGKNVSSVGVSFDYEKKPRPSGSAYDAGAFEFQTGGPTSNAGTDKNITLPTNSLIINGSGTSSTGITGYLWTKKTGGAATLTNETTANLSVSALVEGTYVFELKVTDASGFAFDEVSVNVLPAAANQNPTANAGSDKTVTLPTNTLTLNGIGTDPDGSITSYLWTKVSGPTVTLANANTVNLGLSALLQGTYVFQFTVTDDKSASASDQVTVLVNPASVNQVPLVNAGAEKTIFLPTNLLNITATASDPDGSIAIILWEKKTGGTASLSGTNTLTLTATNLVAGNYTFRITVTDNSGAMSFSEVVVKVIQANQSPVANAGLDQPITLPTNSATLTGTGNDPDGSIISYLWTKVSGPAATLTNANTGILGVTGMVQGTYVFGLTVTDNGGATGFDEVTIVVNIAPTGPNEIPLAIAGGNVSFSLPTNSVNLYGAGFDPDGTIVTYSWVKASGGTATLTNTDKPTLTATNLQVGQYNFKLTVTDDKGATDDDIAVVTVSDLGTNIFPIASAGADKIVRLPLTSTILSGTGTDSDGQITTYNWAQISGAAVIISSPSTPVTNISGLAEGDYTFRLTVTDNLGATDLNETFVRVVSSTNNLPPVVDAGPDIKLFLPQNSLTINATAIDDGTISTYQWTKLSGPTVTLTNPTEQNLVLADLVQGEYSFQFTVSDNNAASVFDIMKLSVLPSTFTPPVANAGADQEITIPINQVSLVGTASVSAGSIVSTVWTKVLGPAATLAGSTTLNLQCTNMVVGTYVFKLTATDNTGKEVSDNVQVIVHPKPPNQIPVTNPGQNYSILLPVSTITLTGTAADSDGSIASVEWTFVSGPNTPALQNALTLALTSSNLVEGLYVFRLTAKDNEGAIGFNDAIVLVTDPQVKVHPPPVAYAGEDIAVVLPETSLSIEGEGVGVIQTYTWEQIEGTPATMNVSQQILNLVDLVEGSYVFKLTVRDTASVSASDEVTVSVIEKDEEIPKFFSPNNDGIGDVWIFRNVSSYQQCSLAVFSRSGQIVYEAKPYQNDWAGTYNGKTLNEGDFYYSLKCDDGRVLSGAIRIIK